VLGPVAKLVGLLSALCWLHDPAITLVESSSIRELQVSTLPERIAIFEATPNKTTPLISLPHGIHLSGRHLDFFDVSIRSPRADDSLVWCFTALANPRQSSDRFMIDTGIGYDVNPVCGRLASIDKFQRDYKGIAFLSDLRRIQRHVGAQLHSRSILRVSHQPARNEHKPPGYKDKKSFPKLKSDERYLGSLLASLLCLWIGWLLDPELRFICPLLALYGIAGLVGRFDLFSIMLMIFG
jgi:hypothetical protein